jgi:hypothetical protein
MSIRNGRIAVSEGWVAVIAAVLLVRVANP